MKNISSEDFLVISEALQDLKNSVTFVGGSTLILLVSDEYRDELRPTKDIDAIVAVTSYPQLHEFEKQLERKGFKRATEKSAPICRWKFKDISFDLMPASQIDGHVTNSWYAEALASANVLALNGTERIRLISPGYFIATKIEAFNSRGNKNKLIGPTTDSDIARNKDLEDIVLLLNHFAFRTELLKQNLTDDALEFIRNFFKKISKASGIADFISRCLSMDLNAERTDKILDVMKRF